ncbi:Oidioi.mRNA.OKI2018_I69.chr1.g2120.t1.cds [Oikopleura dioica]|uniref:Oidioi.mRNA.OKI2018_I69.chr1.g2120.t1.cds n=1 Tax=Oikopleura dioica TaxID=34765 RepID=A0ABN7STM2_OIKDI|nr:Oidioi.mRNA.OKI2018_I69.chr1.g2120.t1.cds [Oikopleura dioica]
MAVIGCASYGFVYIQYTLEEEKLFMEQYCTEEEISAHIHCTAAKEIFGLIWTLTLSCSIIGDLLIKLFQDYFGFFAGRFVCGSLLTVGFATMGMYKTNPYLLFVGQILISLPAYRNLSQNISLGQIYMGENSSIATILFPGIWMFSLITFLVGKKFTDMEVMSLSSFLFLLAAFSLIVHVRSFFLLPKDLIPSPVPINYNLFQASIVGQCVIGKKYAASTQPEIKDKQIEDNNVSVREFFRMLASWRFLFMLFFNAIIWSRCATAMGHVNAWLDYAYYEDSLLCENDPGKACVVDDYKSEIIDVYGYLNCLHIVVPFMLVALLEGFKKCFSKDKAILLSYLTQMFISILHVFAITTIMMMKIPEGGGKGLPLLLVTLLQTVQPIFMTCPQIFVYTFYPRHLAPKVFIVINLFYLPITFIYPALYNFLLQGSVQDYRFSEVSYIFFGLCSLLLIIFPYFAYDAKKYCDEKERENIYKPFSE